MNKEPYIKSIYYMGENRPSRRKLRILLSNGSVIHAEACNESWEQWGGTESELFITMPIIEKHNDWLHGGDRP